MTKFFQDGRLLVSIPPEGFRSWSPESVVFDLTEELICELHPAAASAARTVLKNCDDLGTMVVGMVRPEICADPAVLRWVEKRTGRFNEHLCLSTGRTLQILTNKRNHVFIYGLSSADNRDAFQALCKRAPELFPQFETQVNTVFRVSSDARFEVPSALMQPPTRALKYEQPPLYKWRMTRQGASETVPVEELSVDDLSTGEHNRRIDVTVVNSAALRHNYFLEHLSRELHHALYYGGRTVLQVPDEAHDSLSNWLKSLTESLLRVGFKPPFLPTRAIIISDSSLLPWLMTKSGATINLTLHHSEPLWCYNFEKSEQLKSVSILADAKEINDTIYQEFATEILPLAPRISWSSI